MRTVREPLQRILDNLIANAIEYSPEQAIIACQISTSGASYVLVLVNPAPDIGREDLAQALEPLWRKDAARAGGLHLGLGLALVRSYAEHLDIEIELAQPSVWRVTLRGRLQPEPAA